MSDLDRVIQVDIDAQTKAIAEPNFGMPGLCCYHTQWPERSKLYSSLAGMVTDGFTLTGPESAPYRMAAKLLGQDPQIKEFKILRRALPPTMRIRIVASSVVVGTRYRFKIAGNLVNKTVLDGEDATELATEFKTQIDAFNLDLTNTVATGGLNIVADNAGELFDLSIEPDATHGALTVDVTNADPGIATDLAAIEAADPDWYALQLDSGSKDEIAAAAAWVQAAKKRFIACTGETACLSSGSTTDVMAATESSSYSRVAVLYHSHVNGYAACAWEGVLLPMAPGSYTAMFKPLEGVTIDSRLTAAQIATVKDKHGNCYPSLGGSGSTEEGWASDGTFLDQTRFLDWLKAQIQIDVALALKNLPKVPMSDAGITIIEGAFRAAMSRGVQSGGIDAGRPIKYTIPKIGQVPPNDRALRKLSGLKAEFFLAGAIHSVAFALTAKV